MEICSALWLLTINLWLCWTMAIVIIDLQPNTINRCWHCRFVCWRYYGEIEVGTPLQKLNVMFGKSWLSLHAITAAGSRSCAKYITTPLSRVISSTTLMAIADFSIDTGSSDFWVPDSLCSRCGNSNAYDMGRSSTAKKMNGRVAIEA